MQFEFLKKLFLSKINLSTKYTTHYSYFSTCVLNLIVFLQIGPFFSDPVLYSDFMFILILDSYCNLIPMTII